MKKINALFLSLMLVVSCISFVACGNDDDNAPDSLSGYYLPTIDSETTEEWIRNEEWESDGSLGIIVTCMQFINNNTVKMVKAELYVTQKPGSIGSTNVAGKTVYYIPNGQTELYTYATKDGKIYITNGRIGTILDSKIHLEDGWGTYFKA